MIGQIGIHLLFGVALAATVLYGMELRRTADAVNTSVARWLFRILTGGLIASAVGLITLIITQDGVGGRTMTSSMKFAGGSKTLSTGAGAIDILNISYYGSTYYASLVKGYA